MLCAVAWSCWQLSLWFVKGSKLGRWDAAPRNQDVEAHDSSFTELALPMIDSYPFELPFLDNSPLGLSPLFPLPTLGRGPRSILLLTLLELLRRLRMRISLGSATSINPPARANRIRISVSETTPTRRPEILAPGSADAEIEGPVGAMNGGLGEESITAPGDVEKGSEAGVAVASGGVIA